MVLQHIPACQTLCHLTSSVVAQLLNFQRLSFLSFDLERAGGLLEWEASRRVEAESVVADVVARLVDDMVLHTVVGLQHGRDRDLIAEERLPDGSSSCNHH